MTVERTDLRFALPRPPRTVALAGDAADAADAFRTVGLEVVDGGGPADLVLAPPERAQEALARARQAVAIEGRPTAAALRRAGMATRDLLPLPDASRPAVVLPLDDPAPLRYAVRSFVGSPTRLKALRNLVAPALLARGIGPPGRARLALGTWAAGPPFLVAAARELGVPADVGFFWATGSSDLLSRGALFLFRRGEAAPEWVVKFGRVPGHTEAFERDAAGLATAARAGGAAAAHAPRLVGGLEAGSLPASVETAAAGERLVAVLASAAPRAARLAAVERIAAWIVEMGRETAAGPPAIEPELARLRSDVLPAWRDEGADEDLLAGLDRVPAVLQHNDLGTWNVVMDGTGFTAVDWESARAAGLPLWDLVYFLAYAVIGLDRVAPPLHEQHLVDLFQGRGPSAPLLFRWVRRAVAELGIQADAVGRLATTCWLHHGRSHVPRDAAVRAAGGEPAHAITSLPRRLARRWLREPGLGAGWDRWRA